MLLVSQRLNDELPTNEVQDVNMFDKVVTFDKIGVSVAVTSILLQPLNELSNELQIILPQFLISIIFNLSPRLLKNILGNIPLISISYVPDEE